MVVVVAVWCISISTILKKNISILFHTGCSIRIRIRIRIRIHVVELR
jgi:hypothetical protein